MVITGFLGGLGLLAIILMILVLLLLPLLILIDIILNRFSGNDKLIWLLVVLFLPVIGSLLYLFYGMNQKLPR